MPGDTQPDIYLASHSPRRRELLGQIALPFSPLDVSVDESWDEDESPEVFVIRVALEKARAGWAQVANANPLPTLGADTVVVQDGTVLGKPRDRDDALAMLRALSGSEHRVLTGVALVDDRESTRLSVNRVQFRELSDYELQRYWESGEPEGKAGSYAIQGLGGVFAEHLEGSYSGVMGLPLFETTDLLDEFGIDYRRHW
ncbi:septum formation inhibitor Maf [Aquisalimonas sp. 2447]|uniref:Maf family protein n=1 Tax=Aquisalimonas sp. 2447 TaxID=2740807 RepID=UPI001432599B|nr:Maf family protein [Aquisalimonas sp. 2447]QIT56324.1 septum formation inhibitor Maf [Aquisalimonas sp. 2447]